MEGLSSVLFGVLLVTGVAVLLWRRNRRPLSVVSQGVRCPLHDCQAEVTVRANPEAPPGRRHVNVVACSLLSDGAVGLPEQKAYLADMPPCEVVLERASAHPVYATDAACRQPCLHVLNAASSGTRRPLTCASGVSDGLDLMRQADRHAAGCQSLWFGSTS
jgi:hypothetical protein